MNQISFCKKKFCFVGNRREEAEQGNDNILSGQDAARERKRRWSTVRINSSWYVGDWLMLELGLALRDLLPNFTTLLTANKTSLSVLGLVPVDITGHSLLLQPALLTCLKKKQKVPSSTILSAPGLLPSNPCNRLLIVDKISELIDPWSCRPERIKEQSRYIIFICLN